MFVIKEITRVYVHFKAIDVTNKKVILDQTISICNDKLTFEVLIKVFIDLIKKNMNFQLKCPFKKV